MTTTAVKKNQTITATATETAYTLASDHSMVQTVWLVWVSGSFQATTGPLGGPPVIDGTYATISADKIPLDVDTGTSSIRISGSGTLNIEY